MNKAWCALLPWAIAAMFAAVAQGERLETAPLVAALQAVGPHGQGHVEASQAWRSLSQADAEQLPDILGAMQPGNPLADNWLRSVVESIADRTRRNGQAMPEDRLRRFLDDRTQAPRARWLAFELLENSRPELRLELIRNRLDDPCLPLRREAVAQAILEAEQLATDSQRAETLRGVLGAARDVDQIEDLAKKLQDLGQTIDLPKVYGFVMNWRLVGPFDNKQIKGFDFAHAPEANVDPNAQYAGVDGQVQWSTYSSNDPHGMVDLNAAVGRFKGATVYAYAEFHADREGDVELRLGTPNGSKVWLNGELVASNHVYHAGLSIDQYVGPGRMRAGKNVLLLKIAQNEQTDQWAQDWKFQLRVCDPLGSALLSTQPFPTDEPVVQ